MDPRKLPVYEERERIVRALTDNQVIVVESPTGSGKTTQLPLILYEAGFAGRSRIGVTQPRRIAAVSVCEYIARQKGGEVGGLTGYKMRFEDMTGPETRLKIMTDGILLQELKADYYLSEYDVIIVDEAHERSLNIDFILGLLKRVLAYRPEFRVVISSATINAEIFSEYYDECPVVRIDAPMYPVEVRYEPPPSRTSREDLLYRITEIVERTLEEGPEGDILIFLSGEQDIKDCMAHLIAMSFRKYLDIRPLYGRLSKEEQEQVFDPPREGRRKVVVATNIAETSVTIDGITTVIDPGLAKLNYYNPRTFTSSLVEGPISRASANQRKGRAGRTQPGVCYRLYDQEDFHRRQLFTTEEIYRTDLSEVVLRMAELGIRDFEGFDFISPPSKSGIVGAIETLNLLGALESDRTLSDIGQMMARFPLMPHHSRMIVEAIRSYPNVIAETIVAASFLTSNTPFLLPEGEEVEARRAHHRFRDRGGDFVSYLRLLDAYRSSRKKQGFCRRNYLDTRTMAEIRNVADQLGEIVSEEFRVAVSSGGPIPDYLCAVATGLIQFVCVRTGKTTYRSLTAERIQIHPGSVMFRETPRFIVAGEIVRTSRMYARSVSPLEREWVERISPDLASRFIDTDRPGSIQKARERDTTWEVQIGRRTFTLKPYKGKKKIAILPWRDVAALARDDNLFVPPPHANLRGTVVYENLEFLTGERVGSILEIAKCLELPRDLVDGGPRGRSFSSDSEDPTMLDAVSLTLCLAKLKKSSRRLGFLCLKTDGSGRYWLKPTKSFYYAVDESLASLEVLVDELADKGRDESIPPVNTTYRRLVTMIEGE